MYYHTKLHKKLKGGIPVKQKIEYAALKYYNNIISDECLYIGMLFHNLTTGKRDFRYISNFSRFQSFDDEADIEFVKAYLRGIKQQVENNIFNYNTPFSIINFARIYVNEFRFSDVRTIEIEPDEPYVENLTKMYLKFDFSRNKRLSKNEEKKYIRKILSSSNVALSTPQVPGIFKEPVNFDYLIGNIAVKIFSFREKMPKDLFLLQSNGHTQPGNLIINTKLYSYMMMIPPTLQISKLCFKF